MAVNPYPCTSSTFQAHVKIDAHDMFNRLVKVLGNATYYGYGLPTERPYVLLVDLDLYSWYIDLKESKVYQYTNGGWNTIGNISDPAISLIPRTPQVLLYDSGLNQLSLSSGNTISLKQTGFKFIQLLPITIWTITHNLKKQPTVVILDNSGNEVIADINSIDLDTLTLSFSIPFSGTAYLN